jgi:hypothetical protein
MLRVMKGNPMPLALALAACALAGCAALDSPTDLAIEAGGYPTAFEAARTTLRDYHFELERVDARAGVISTTENDTAGFFTPWDLGRSSFQQELEDSVQYQRRIVRITFEDPSRASTTAEQTETDLRELPGRLTMRVRVVIERVYRPGWRINTTAIGLSTRTFDPALAARGMLPEFEVAVTEDRPLAARLVKAVQEQQSRTDIFQMPGNWKDSD